MQWPSRAEYTEAVRDYPHVSLQDPKLRGGKSRRGKDNLVISDTGAFSIVFPIDIVDIVSRTFALRCWVKDVGDAKNRYEKISAYLKQKDLSCFVDFEYVPEGILVNGTKYPITRMEWVEGVSLREFIEQNLQTPTSFKTVATKFQKMVAVLHTHQIAHGDLQDGNILLKKNGSTVEIKLIDYDSLFVPSLQGQPEHILGLPEYQHPRRIAVSEQANEKVDYFSELVIYLSFLSLAEKPELWNQFRDETERGLLFSKKDFENPDDSDVFQELEKLSPDVRQLAATLKDFCAKTSIDQLERLEVVLPKPDANAYTNSGFSFLRDGRYREALVEFQKAIDIKPTYSRAYFGRGHVYRRNKGHTNAIVAFQQAIKFKPNYKEAHYGLGVTYFELDDNIKAEAMANAALQIDPDYLHAHELLDAIKSGTFASIPSSSAKSKPRPTASATPPPPAQSKSTSTRPTSSSTSSQPTQSNPLPNVMKRITEELRVHWQFVAMITLGLALVICFTVLLIQIKTGNKVHSDKITKLENQLNQKESKIQELFSSVQALKSDKKELGRNNSRLQKSLQDSRSISSNVIDLQRQLSQKEAALVSWRNEGRRLQNQLAKKDTELQTQVSIIRRLRSEKTKIQNENRRLKSHLDGSNSGPTNQNITLQQLQKEKEKTITENQRLQTQNQNLIRQNQRLRAEKKSLQNQLSVLPPEI